MPRGEGSIDILLVEDSQSDIGLFSEGLKSCPYRTNLHVASDGAAALKSLFQEHFTPDLIILDINLPKVNGYEVLQRLKDSALRDIPVIVFSSAPDRMEPPYAEEYVKKPLYLEEYLQTIRQICNEWLARLA
jgi:CheY-like chemotaxis protein